MTWSARLAAGALVVAVGSVAACGSGGSGGYEARDLRTGAAVSVDDLRGEPALLVSWATWCRECDDELEGLQEFAESPSAEGISIVAINIDAADVEDEIDAKIEAHGLTTELWRDRRNEFKAAFGALGVPTTVLLDGDGDVAGTFAGAVDFADEDVLAALDEVRAGGS